MRRVELSQQASQDLAWWARSNRSTYQRILRLIDDSRSTPFAGIGKPEPLRYGPANTWSRRIDQRHRMVYRVYDDAIQIVAARFHYNEQSR